MLSKCSITELYPQTLAPGAKTVRLVKQLLLPDNLSFSFSPSLSSPSLCSLPHLAHIGLKLPMLAEAGLQLLIPPACASQGLTLQVYDTAPRLDPHTSHTERYCLGQCLGKSVVFDGLGIGKKMPPKTG